MNSPETLDALVIGANIVGMLTALELAHRGLSVRLIDKDFTGPVRTHVGEIAPLGGDRAMNSLYSHSVQAWREAEQRYGVETGLTVRGLLDLATSPGRANRLAAEVQAESADGFGTTFVKEADVLTEHAGTAFGKKMFGAKWWADAPLLSTHTALETLRREIVAKGILVWGQDEVKELLTEDDRLTGVRIAGGETCLAEHVIVCSGVLAGNLLKTVGPRLPLRPARTHLLTLSVAESIGEPMLVHRLRRGHIWMKRLREGPLMLAYDGLMDPAQATFTATPNPHIVQALCRHAARLMPVLEKAKVVESLAHIAAVTPDFRPALGRWPEWKGLYLATGFAARSYAFAAGAARLLGQMVAGEQPAVDLAPFSPDRFATGQWRRVGHPFSLDWKEPLVASQTQLVDGHPDADYMENVNLTEKPEAQYAHKVNQVERKVVIAGGSKKKEGEGAEDKGYFGSGKVKAAALKI